MIVAAKGKRHVGNTAAYFCEWHLLLDDARGLDKIYRVIVMFFNAGSDCKNIGIENNILWCKAHLFGQYFIGPFGDRNFFIQRIGLAVFVERHYNHRSAVALAGDGLFNKFSFTFLE